MLLLTIAAAVSCTTHGVPCATLSNLPAGKAGASGVVAEFINSTLFIIRANTWLLLFGRKKILCKRVVYDVTVKYLTARSVVAHRLPFTHGTYLQGVCGLVSDATRGRGTRTRTDSVGAFAPKNTGQVFDGVGVHQDCPRVNFPKVSKECEIHSQEAMRCRYLHDSPVRLCSVDNTQGVEKKNPFFLAIKVAWVTESNAALRPEFPSFQRVSDTMLSSLLPPSPGMISLYMWTCLSSRPSLCTTKAEGWNFKESHCTEMAVFSRGTGVSQCLCNDNDLQSLSACPSLGDAHWKLYPNWRFTEPC